MTQSTKENIRYMNKIPERLRMYGVEIKKGRCRGFCHNGHDFNMVVKDDFCYCFVCNRSFDIFGVVQHFEKCNFLEAVRKLNRGMDFETFRVIKRAKFEYEKRQREQKQAEEKYWQLWSKWILIDTIIRYADPYSQLYADALHKREYLNYLMEVEL